MAYVSKEDKAKLAPAIKAVLKKYGMKGSISIRHYSSLVVKIPKGRIDFSEGMLHGREYIDVNQYHIDKQYSGEARDFLNELLAAMEGPDFYNRDDAMTDYFDRSHYTDIKIGEYDKPYAFLGETV